MPLEGSAVRQYLSVNFLNNLQGILDIDFRTGGLLVFIPDGEVDNYLVNGANDAGVAFKTFGSNEIGDILESGTFAHKQAQAFYRYNITEGLIIFPYQLPQNPSASDINDGYQAFFDYINSHVGLGWPYLHFTNIGNVDVPELSDPTFTSEASSFIESEEALIALRQTRENYGNSSDLADAAIVSANALNSRRSILVAHTGDDTDLDGTPDAEAELDALLMGAIAQFPVGGWEITGKPVEGLPIAQFTPSEQQVLQGAFGSPGAITASPWFQDAAFRINKTTGGTFIDVTQVEDYLRFRYRQAYAIRMRNQNKIPYTFLGGQEVKSLFAEVNLAEVEDPETNLGIVRRRADNTPDFTISVPAIDQIPQADRANRLFGPVNQNIGYTASIIQIDSNVVLEV